MHDGQRRAPPPPSKPPPDSICRSGRVPPPRGAPPPGRTRLERSLRNQSTQGDRGIRVKNQDRNASKRRSSGERARETAKDSSSDDSSEEYLNNGYSARAQSDMPLLVGERLSRSDTRSLGGTDATQRARHPSRSGGGLKNETGVPADTADPERASHKAGAYSDREIQDNDCSARDTESRDGTGSRNSRTSCDRRARRDPAFRRRSGRSRVHSDTRRRHERPSASYSDSGHEDSRRLAGVHDATGRSTVDDSRRENSHERVADSADSDSNGSFLTYSDEDEQHRSPLSSTGSEGLRTSEASLRQRRQCSGGGRARERRGVRSVGSETEEDSEAEGYGCSKNKYRWDGTDSHSRGSHSHASRDPSSSRERASESRRRRWHRASDDDDYASGQQSEEDKGAGQMPSDTEACDLSGSARRHRTRDPEQVHLETNAKKDVAPETRATAISGRASTPPKRDSVPRTEKARQPSGSTVMGKPIRGARWGEAIGLRSKIFDASTIPTGKTDSRKFVCLPLRSGPGTVLRCFIERNRNGGYKFSTTYSFYADLEDGSGRLLLAARKLLASKTAYYQICTRQETLYNDGGRRGGHSFLGKLRATSAAHTEYALYDGGKNPATAAVFAGAGYKLDSTGDMESKSTTPFEYVSNSTSGGKELPLGEVELRRELAVIIYNFDKKEQRTGKRRMEVAIPQTEYRDTDEWEPVSWQPSEEKESMKRCFGRVRYQGAQNSLQDDRLIVFHQRESRYDPLSSCLVDFRGRATAPSVKNFQLLKSPPEDNAKRQRYYSEGGGKDEQESNDVPKAVFLQMGKVGKDCFNVDVEWPLSLLQAFAICLSRFDTNAHF